MSILSPVRLAPGVNALCAAGLLAGAGAGAGCGDHGAAPCWRRVDDAGFLGALAGATCGREAYATAREGYANPIPPVDLAAWTARAETMRARARALARLEATP